MTTDGPTDDARHPSADYLEALYELEEEGFPMVQAEIARWMGVSRPSVSEHVKRLVGDGLLTADGRTLGFTDRGR
jgi:Mn-dependent DtxR family transcriptional regulator